jgi:hypothetical protein
MTSTIPVRVTLVCVPQESRFANGRKNVKGSLGGRLDMMPGIDRSPFVPTRLTERPV